MFFCPFIYLFLSLYNQSLLFVKMKQQYGIMSHVFVMLYLCEAMNCSTVPKGKFPLVDNKVYHLCSACFYRMCGIKKKKKIL